MSACDNSKDPCDCKYDNAPCRCAPSAVVKECIPGIPVRFKKLSEDAKAPEYKTPGAAGADLCSVEEVTIPPRQVRTVRTGLAVALPPGYELQIRSRSGLAAKNGISVKNSPGTIDEDYRGEVMVILYNSGPDSFKVRKGDRIAQAVLAPVYRARFDEVELLDETARGAGGLGSTGA